MVFTFYQPIFYTDIEIDIKTTKLAELIKLKWQDIYTCANVFRYDIECVCEKYVGKYFLQLNLNRFRKRRLPQEILELLQPFNHEEFNFNKVCKQELMFIMKEQPSDTHTALVNVSPISRFHSLLCPSIDKCLPQIITKDSLKLAIDLILMADERELRIAFNSLCALASVNHLHFHLFLENNDLPVESVECHHLASLVYTFDESHPATAFCFFISPEYDINEIFKLFDHLLKKLIPHNIFITRGLSLDGKEGIRLIVYPRKSSVDASYLGAFNVAACELSGWFIVDDREEYENLEPKHLEEELKNWNLDEFDELCEEVKLLYNLINFCGIECSL